MALLTVDFFSEALAMGTSMTVVLPQATDEQVGVTRTDVTGPPPVLHLLHGLSDDHSGWTRYTSVERYATAAGLAVVMPAAGRSFYADEVHGHRYWEHVSEEVPRVVAEFLRVSQDPADTYVAGLSMGGYGAMKLALTHPGRYAAAASLSGALDLPALFSRPDRDDVFRRVFDGQVGPDDDLFALLDGVADIPPLHISCGSDDHLLASSRRFAAAAAARGFDITTDIRPGDHEWGLWDVMVAEVINWITRLRA